MWSKSAFNSDLKICNHMKENFGNLKCEEALKSLLGCLISSKLRSIIN